MAASRKIFGLIIVLAAFGPSGCDKAAKDSVKNAPTADPSAQTAGQEASEPVVPSVWPAKARAFLGEWRSREGLFREAYAATFKDELTKRKAFVKLSSQVYEQTELNPIFTNGLQLNKAGTAMLAALNAVETHGLDPKAYHREEIQGLITRIEEARQTYETAWQAPEGGKVRKLWGALKGLKERDPNRLVPAEIEAEIKAVGLGEGDVELLPTVDTLLTRVFEAKAALNLACVQADMELLGAFFRYAYDMRFALLAHPFEASAKYWDGVKRQKDALYDFYLATDFDNLADALTAMSPKVPEYAQMQRGLARYVRLAAEVEQTKLPRKTEKLKKLKKRKKDDLVKKLQERLAQEGYFEAETTGVYDDATAAAVALYQETHQLKITGDMDRSTRKSLNRTFKTRAGQVQLALMRHRESDLHRGEWRFGEVPLQARVNIAAFEAKFYKEGQLARRHRIIVGNDRLSVDEKSGYKGWFNRTRLFSKQMVTVVLNPTWRVPKRIKEQELDRELLEEPDYYEKNGYEVRILDNGSEQVVQLAGPGNALGQVKFLFPNRFSIYMHDTPKRHLFKRHIRAFSHGCMRLEDPVDLARWILVEQEGRTDKWMKKVLKSRETYGVPLKTKIPVTIEYNTVGVHKTGRMMFYLDVYRFDRDYRAGKTPYPKLPGRSLEQAVVTSRADAGSR